MRVAWPETVWASARGWYNEIVTALPLIADGCLSVLMGPGLGLGLRPAFLARGGVGRRRSGAGAA